jgi:undecaprenyl-diphosphatase
MVGNWLAWFRNRDLLLLAALLAAALGVWGFIALADEVVEGDAQKLDERIVRAFRDPANPPEPRGPPWLRVVGRDVTALGSPAVLLLFIAAVAGYLAMTRNYPALLFLLVAVLGGGVLVGTLKEWIDRPRPPFVLDPHLVGPSFPSGHSMNSAIVYLTLGTLLAQMVERRRLKLYFIGVALLATFLVGLSRVYLAVHYPTDVLAGWSLGLAWAILCWVTARYLRRRVPPVADAPGSP